MLLAPLLTVLLIANAHGLVVRPSSAAVPSFVTRAPSRHQHARMCSLPSDADLFASLRKRTAAQESDAAPAPLGPDEVGADQMGPAEVVSYCMRSMKVKQDGAWQGLKALMAFAVKYSGDKAEDYVGQVR